ncbi:MAG: hypothetical protein Q8P05_00745 [Candidatus Diapherotrites archaeon]|nr:hypothetical protein [Candidatus Diapherotrites archaeon]MDZ4256193.1 hypothetical protein [archaeon]
MKNLLVLAVASLFLLGSPAWADGTSMDSSSEASVDNQNHASVEGETQSVTVQVDHETSVGNAKQVFINSDDGLQERVVLKSTQQVLVKNLILINTMKDNGRTLLIAHLFIDGPYQEEGDTFKVKAIISNVGMVTAENVMGELMFVPEGWQVTPADKMADFGDLPSGDSREFIYTITRDAEDSTLVFEAKGDNTNKATSNALRVPIHPLVAFALVGSMLGGYGVYLRRKQVS